VPEPKEKLCAQELRRQTVSGFAQLKILHFSSYFLGKELAGKLLVNPS
jgi:hypothetical protein